MTLNDPMAVIRPGVLTDLVSSRQAMSLVTVYIEEAMDAYCESTLLLSHVRERRRDLSHTR